MFIHCNKITPSQQLISSLCIYLVNRIPAACDRHVSPLNSVQGPDTLSRPRTHSIARTRDIDVSRHLGLSRPGCPVRPDKSWNPVGASWQLGAGKNLSMRLPRKPRQSNLILARTRCSARTALQPPWTHRLADTRTHSTARTGTNTPDVADSQDARTCSPARTQVTQRRCAQPGQPPRPGHQQKDQPGQI